MELVEAYTERGVDLYFVHLRRVHEDRFRAVGIDKYVRDMEEVLLKTQLGRDHFLTDLRSAMARIEEMGGASTL